MSIFGLIGDVHAQDDLLLQALDHFRAMHVEAILCVGDVVDGPGDANRCCELLQHFKVRTVRGNHDRWILNNEMRSLPGSQTLGELSDASRTFLAALPPTIEIQCDGGPLLLCHGVGSNDMAALKSSDFGYALEMNQELQRLLSEDQFRFAVSGHSHERMHRRFDSLSWINPGTLLCETPSVSALDLCGKSLRHFEFQRRTLSSASAEIQL